MLTRKQDELLRFIDSKLQSSSISPSFDEMRVALGLRSKSGVHRLIQGLVERGFLQQRKNRARALEVIRLPSSSNTPDTNQMRTLPFLGQIAAGHAAEASKGGNQHIQVPAFMVGPGEHYALRVHGSSMIQLGIHDGDIALIQSTQSANSGDVVVALIDNAELTLKTFRPGPNTVALESANPEYPTQNFGPHKVKVQGKLIGLLRRY